MIVKEVQPLTNFIQIPEDADNMCCARAIATAKAKIDKHHRWNSIRNPKCHILTALAAALQKRAGIPEGTVCGLEEWQKFQTELGNDYQLCICSREFFNTIVYSGPVFSEKQIYLYLAENHFSVITSMHAFLGRAYFCKKCQVGYSNLGDHACIGGCKQCKNTQACLLVKWHGCSGCNRYFKSQECYENHLKNQNDPMSQNQPCTF